VDGALLEDHLQVVVGIDHPLVLLVLQAVLLDVGPELLGDLGSRDRLAADHFGERGARRHGLHERGVRLTRLGGFLLRSLGHLFSYFRCRSPAAQREITTISQILPYENDHFSYEKTRWRAISTLGT